MKRLIVALALVASLGMAGHALAMDKKINIFNGAQYDIYTLYLSPTNANDWEENLLKQETLPNGDKVDVEVSRTEKAEAWDVKVTNKAGETMTWIGVPLNKWYRFVTPLFLMMLVLEFVFMTIAVWIGY
jgi:hypothetical protein